MIPNAAKQPPRLLVIRTRELRLEPLVEAHANSLFRGLRSDALYEFIGESAPESVEALATRFRRLETRVSPDGHESWLNWAIRSLDSREYVGVVQATVHPDRSAHIAYILFPEAWGRGYARQAVHALIHYLQFERALMSVRATVDVRNRRSIALLERLGFARVALRQNAEVIRGVPSDEFDYFLLLDGPPFSTLQ